MTIVQKIKQLGIAGIAAVTLGSATGCVSTDTAEIAVVYCKWACGSDRRPDVVQGGRTEFYVPLRTQSYVLDSQLQTLSMTGKDAIIFKTQEGNDVEQDVVVTWKIDSTQAQKLVEEVGTSVAAIEAKYVRPLARSIIRDRLNELESKAFYEGQNRFKQADEATTELRGQLKLYGIILDQVNIQEYRFEKAYQVAINDAKNAGQDKEKYEQQIESQKEHWKKELETQRGISNQTIAQAEGAKTNTIQTADAFLYQSQEQAKAIVEERKAEAAAITKLRQAMASGGGETAILREYVKHFNPDEIHVLPCSTGNGSVSVQRLDVNALMAAEAARESAKPRQE